MGLVHFNFQMAGKEIAFFLAVNWESFIGVTAYRLVELGISCVLGYSLNSRDAAPVKQLVSPAVGPLNQAPCLAWVQLLSGLVPGHQDRVPWTALSVWPASCLRAQVSCPAL